MHRHKKKAQLANTEVKYNTDDEGNIVTRKGGIPVDKEAALQEDFATILPAKKDTPPLQIKGTKRSEEKVAQTEKKKKPKRSKYKEKKGATHTNVSKEAKSQPHKENSQPNEYTLTLVFVKEAGDHNLKIASVLKTTRAYKGETVQNTSFKVTACEVPLSERSKNIDKVAYDTLTHSIRSIIQVRVYRKNLKDAFTSIFGEEDAAPLKKQGLRKGANDVKAGDILNIRTLPYIHNRFMDIENYANKGLIPDGCNDTQLQELVRASLVFNEIASHIDLRFKRTNKQCDAIKCGKKMLPVEDNPMFIPHHL